MNREFRILNFVIVMLFLIANVAFAAPKSDQGNGKGITPSINMDEYVSIYNNKTFSITGSRNTTLNITRTQYNSTSSTETWIYQDDPDLKQIYSFTHDGQATFMTGYEVYYSDVLTDTATYNPAIKYFPLVQTLPYQTWGGIYNFVIKNAADSSIVLDRNEWREYRFCGYEDVTVPYGTFQNALKIRRLRMDEGLTNYWYVPEVGLVKSENIWRSTGFMEIHELVSASF